MRKSIRLAQKKDGLHDLGPDDLLSRFSDDILVFILSYLPLKDAALTSKLSSRWRYLWCHRVCLDVQDKERSNKIGMERDRLFTSAECNKYTKFCFAERNKYINWVNHIIRQHKSPTIDKFRICFDLDEDAKGAIRKWIEFAISKKVRTLELDFSDREDNMNNYVFPNKIFDMKYGSSLKRPSIKVPIRPYATVMEIKFLKSLILKCVDVNDEGLKKILSICPVLEHLSIDGSTELVKAKIKGEGLALKTLEIRLCVRLESIEICDSNIVSISCKGFYYGIVPITLRLDNVQKLEKMCIGKAYSWKKNNHVLCQISCCIPYLQVLELGLDHPQRATDLLPYPDLPKLKQLIVKVEIEDGDSIIVLSSLVEACPNLQRLKIQLKWHFNMKPIMKYLEERQVAKKLHQHLEVVEICDYFGLTCDLQTSDLELAMYFIENAVGLKKLVIQPLKTRGRLGNKLVGEDAARYNAQQQLEPITPAGVELVIL